MASRGSVILTITMTVLAVSFSQSQGQGQSFYPYPGGQPQSHGGPPPPPYPPPSGPPAYPGPQGPQRTPNQSGVLRGRGQMHPSQIQVFYKYYPFGPNSPYPVSPPDMTGRSRVPPADIQRFAKYFPGPPQICGCRYPDNPLLYAIKLAKEQRQGLRADRQPQPPPQNLPQPQPQLPQNDQDFRYHYRGPFKPDVDVVPVSNQGLFIRTEYGRSSGPGHNMGSYQKPHHMSGYLEGDGHLDHSMHDHGHVAFESNPSFKNCPEEPNLILQSMDKPLLATAKAPGCQLMTWFEANDFCQAKNMKALSFDNSKLLSEKEDLLKYLEGQNIQSYWTSGSLLRVGDDRPSVTWSSSAGLADEVEPGNGLWSASGPQPDNAEDQEDCVAVIASSQGNDLGLHDQSCQRKHSVVCEHVEVDDLTDSMTSMIQSNMML